jgi:serine/threonine-protein kinase
LLKGYNGLKQRGKSIPRGNTSISEAIDDRLIEFYTATNRPDEVTKWRAERAKYPATSSTPRQTTKEQGPSKN